MKTRLLAISLLITTILMGSCTADELLDTSKVSNEELRPAKINDEKSIEKNNRFCNGDNDKDKVKR
jgi:hypothetical protein